MKDHLRIEVKDRVGRIAFNSPKTLNAFTPELLGDLIDTLRQFEDDPCVKTIVLTGTGESFSSGGDLAFLNSLTKLKPFEIRNTVYRYFGGAAKAVKLFSKPTIAAVNGPAVGAGCEIAVACDFRIASDRAMFSEAWIKLGAIPPLGGMFLLPRLIGLGRATDMIMRGTRVGAEEALRIGLVNEVVPHAELDAAAMRLANEFAEGPPLAYAVVKEGLRRGMESTLDAEAGFNVYAQSMLLNTEDHAEYLAARGQKRPAKFKGT